MLTAALAGAGSITYQDFGPGSGTLGGTPYTNQTVTFTLTGDTINITQPIAGIFNLVAPVTVTVAGIGTATFLTPMWVFSNENTHKAGFTAGTGDVVSTNNVAFSTYNLSTGIGPIPGDTFFTTGVTYSTSVGNFTLTAYGNTDNRSTFTAVATPEPATLALLGIGLGAVGMIRRRRR